MIASLGRSLALFLAVLFDVGSVAQDSPQLSATPPAHGGDHQTQNAIKNSGSPAGLAEECLLCCAFSAGHSVQLGML